MAKLSVRSNTIEKSEGTVTGLTTAIDTARQINKSYEVYLGLYHYMSNQDAIDAVIKRELAFNARDTLNEPSMTLPSVGLTSLVETLKEGS